MKSPEKVFDEYVEEAKKDPSIIGFFLSGSRGKNRQTKHSDYDIEIVVKDEDVKSYKKKYKKLSRFPFGFSVFALSEFKTHAERGSPFEWNRPSYTYINAIIDKTGEIQKLIEQKGKIPKSEIKKHISGHLDGYINHVYRSLKCLRDENPIGARKEASRSIHTFLDIIFALEGRHVPYYKYLEWELKAHPLKKFRMHPNEITGSILKILETADVKTQQKLFDAVEKIFRKEGYGKVFDSWSPEQIKFIKTLKR